MATDDVQRLVTGVASTPAHFTVPGNGQIQPKAIFATFDGTGAAGAFLPTMKIISDGGETIVICPTPTQVVAGASADVSWFPGVGGVATAGPGILLSTYRGLLAAADFTYNSAVYVASNFPANGTFTKKSSTSVLDIRATADYTNGAVPDVIFCAIFIDGVNTEACGFHVSVANYFNSVTVQKVQGLSQIPADNPLPAGVHTVNLAVANTGTTNVTMRSSTSCDLEILEFEPN
jgi:hypothetical protein